MTFVYLALGLFDYVPNSLFHQAANAGLVNAAELKIPAAKASRITANVVSCHITSSST
jgi:hypothetical protein